MTIGSSLRLMVPSATVRSSGPWNVVVATTLKGTKAWAFHVWIEGLRPCNHDVEAVTVAEHARHRHRSRKLLEVLWCRVVGHLVDHDEGVSQLSIHLLGDR